MTRSLVRLALSRFKVPREAIRFGLRRHRARVALAFSGGSRTFAQLEDRVGRLVGALQRRGLGNGALVLCALDDGPELLEARFAAFELGVRLAGVAPWADPASVPAYGQLGAPAALLLDARLPPPLAAALRAHCPSGPCLTTGPEWEAALAEGPPVRSDAPVRPSDVAAVGFTSGTTGQPKVVMTPQAALLTSLKLTATNVVRAATVKGDEVMTSGIPLNGAGSGLVLPMALTGAKLVLPDGRGLLERLRDERVTRAFVTPSQLLDLLDDERFERSVLPALRNVIYGTAPMPVPRLEEALRRLGPIFQQGYGMAEVLPPVSLLQMEQHVDAQGAPASREVLRSVGWVVPEVQVRVVDEGLNEVPAGTVGEILVKSPTVFSGYWRLEGLDRTVFHEGYLRTGDLGTLRADGLLTVLDRAADVLRRGGRSWSARLMEEQVYDDAAVKEACLVQRAPEAPVVLFVSPRVGRVVDPEALRARLEAAGLLVEAVRVLPQLPRSPLQKLLRREVRGLLS